MKEKPALLIIDLINPFDFSHGKQLASKADSMIQTINGLRLKFYLRDWPVIFINDHYNLWQYDLTKLISYCQNDISHPILNQITPNDQDYFLIKPKHSAFFDTALDTLLRTLQVNTLYLAGVAGNICVLFTANDAYMREYNLYVPSNCIASVSDQDNEYALKMMNQVLKANIEPIS
ncbi:cysteine hydrolase [Cytobacillus spongiae]|jgi:nicotinamidase-related amidase|nr:isochorismatase family cysteine hydrolase [Cytobacillus spongiae]UII55980.1 cysteine hydrolase [Cytobacillus spongiae]